MDAAPIAALNHLHDIKSGAIGGLYRIGLLFRSPDKKDPPLGRQAALNSGRESIERTGQNVREHAI